MSSTKRCTKCGEVKPLDAFNRHRKGALGRRSRCRACQREYNRTWREANRDRKREYNREYYAANRDHWREYARAWRAANRGHKRAYDRAWYEANRDLRREYARRRRARKRAATVEELAPADIYTWWEELGAYTCFWCGL